VVKLCGEDAYAINTNYNFGLASASGVYGEMGDATTDIFRAHGIGPLSKWVDDHIFFHICCEYIQSYNAQCKCWHATIVQNGGCIQSGSHLWYCGEAMPNNLPAEFDKDTAHSIHNYSHLSNCPESDALFTYCDADIDILSEQLGIP
jgi:hypothetical protein